MIVYRAQSATYAPRLSRATIALFRVPCRDSCAEPRYTLLISAGRRGVASALQLVRSQG